MRYIQDASNVRQSYCHQTTHMNGQKSSKCKMPSAEPGEEALSRIAQQKKRKAKDAVNDHIHSLKLSSKITRQIFYLSYLLCYTM